MRLKDKVAIITGAGSGIGRETALLFSQEGAFVFAVDIWKQALKDLSKEDPHLNIISEDISLDGAARRIVSKVVDRMGGLDILINNAGVGFRSPANQTTLDDWDRVVGINARAAFLLSQEAFNPLTESVSGRIINVSSLMAIYADHGLAAYSASKAALGAVTRALAVEYGKYGITVNHVLPGPIKTAMTQDDFRHKNIRDSWEKKTALRRLGEAREIANCILFLASEEGSYITGHGLRADGGAGLRP